MIQAIERLYRFLMNSFGRGRIKLVDDSGPVQKAQIVFGALETVDGVPIPHDFGFTSNPPIDSDAFAGFLGGIRKNGMVIAIGNQTYRMRNLRSGEVAIYDNRGQSVYLSAAGIVVNGAGLPLTVNNTPVVTVNAATKVALNTPELDVSGKIVAGGDITDNAGSNLHSMAQMRTIYNGHEHDIHNVQPGTSTVTSNPPNQLE
jgi:phage baseplate assembly protein V